MGKAGIVLMCLCLVACRDSETESLQTEFQEELSLLKQLQQSQQESLDAMSVQLDNLSKPLQLDFQLSKITTSFNERAFQPMMTASSQLLVTGQSIPDMFYVDVLLEVAIHRENFQSRMRQVFPVSKGQSRIELQQPLPVHGLSLDQVKVSLTPVNWYLGQAIPSAAIHYDAF